MGGGGGVWGETEKRVHTCEDMGGRGDRGCAMQWVRVCDRLKSRGPTICGIVN